MLGGQVVGEPADPVDAADALATGLGWFSIGLGLTEILAPQLITRPLGLEGREDLVRLYGAREIAAGLGILASSGPARAPWMWARVAGDVLDVAMVVDGLNQPDPPSGTIGVAFAALAGVGMADLHCAVKLSAARHDGEALELVPPPPVRYSDAVEAIAPDEDAVIDRIVAIMGKGGEVVREREGRAMRTSHAKAHGIVRGEMRVERNLPPELRQGLFAEPRTFSVMVRLAQVPGEALDDRRVSTPRGMAIKVLDVPGEPVPGHDRATQDFVLDTGKAFISANAKTFLAAIAATEAAAPLPEGVKSAVSTASRATNAVLNAVGLNSPKLDFFGHPFRHPLSEAYFSQCAIRYGDFIGKLGVFPDMPQLSRLAREPLRLEDENGLRTVVTEYFRTNPAEFVVAIQLCTDLRRMPVEDASVEWPEDESPYRAVARLVLPAQDAWHEGVEAVDESLAFSPAHSLAAHRPLGSIMRARMRAYEELGRKRRELNGRPIREPSAHADHHAPSA